MEYCFIEKWGFDCKLPENCKAVALTPGASYQLEKSGIAYLTFGDYFSSGEIRGDTDSYLASQVLWFKEFDQFVTKLFPETEKLKIKLPSLYLHNIKYMVDCIILTSRIINKFIELTKPSKIWFVPQIYGEDKLGRWEYFSFGKSSFYRLAPLICEKNNIAFEELKFEKVSGHSAASDAKNTACQKNNINLLSKEAILAKLRVIKWKLLRYSCLFYQLRSRKVNKTVNVFVIVEFPYTYAFYKDAKKAGFGIYYKENDIIRELDWLPKAVKIDFKDNKGLRPKDTIDFESAVNDLIKSNIMYWVNERCGLDVSSVLYSRLKFFLEEVFVETVIRIRKYTEFYDKYKIDFVVSYINSRVDDFAAIAAAGASVATKSVSFFHGVDALDFKSRYFSEYCHFDYFFVSTSQEVQHIRDLAALFNDKTIKVNEYSHFRDQFSLKSKNRINKYLNKTGKPVVIFIPIMIVERMNMPIEKAQSLQWDYFKWHRALIRYFSRREDFHFIWKGLLQYPGRGDVIADIIKDAKASNITYSTGGLREWLPRAERVLCDIPSTAFYECIFNKVPVLSMYRPNDQKLYKDAYRSYGASLQPYSCVDEGLNVIEKYLNDKPENYVVPLSSNNIFVPDVLTS